MVKVDPTDVPPPGEGLKTVTVAVPAVAMSDARMLACNLVTRPPGVTVGVVVRFDPFHRTTDVEVKVLPLTVKVKPGSPAVMLLGLSDVMTGNGALTLKFTRADCAPLGLIT